MLSGTCRANEANLLARGPGRGADELSGVESKGGRGAVDEDGGRSGRGTAPGLSAKGNWEVKSGEEALCRGQAAHGDGGGFLQG